MRNIVNHFRGRCNNSLRLLKYVQDSHINGKASSGVQARLREISAHAQEDQVVGLTILAYIVEESLIEGNVGTLYWSTVKLVPKGAFLAIPIAIDEAHRPKVSAKTATHAVNWFSAFPSTSGGSSSSTWEPYTSN